MNSVSAENSPLASASAGLSYTELLPRRESPVASVSMNLGRSPLHRGSSPTSASPTAFSTQQSITLRSSFGLGTGAQHQQLPYGRPSSGKGISRSQSRVGGASCSVARSATPPLLPSSASPADSATVPVTASQSSLQTRSMLRGAHYTPPEHSNDVRSASDRLHSAQQPQPQSQHNLPRGEGATGKEVPVLYTPATLKRRSEVEDIYTTCFLTTLHEETLDSELVFSFKSSMAKVSSPFSNVRKEGLCESLQQIRAIGMCAAAEVQQCQVDSLATATAVGSKHRHSPATTPSFADSATGTAGVPPILRSPSPRSQSLNSQHPITQLAQQQQQPQPQPQGSGASGVGAGALTAALSGSLSPSTDTFFLPFDAIRATMAGLAVGQSPRSYASDTWSRAQRALTGSDFTSAVFRRVLAPRSEVRAAMNMGGPVNVELSTEDALAWSSRRPPVELSPLEKLKLESKRAMMAKAGVDRQQQLQQQFQSPSSPALKMHGGGGVGGGVTRRMTPCGFEVVVPETPMYALMTEITFQEQELALRLLQGLCLTINYQRRCIAEGCFFHYATEVFQCFLQHVEAVFTQRRLLHLSMCAASGLASAQRSNQISGQRGPSRNSAAGSDSGHNNTGPALTRSSSVYVNTPIPVVSGTFSPHSTPTTHMGTVNLQNVVRVPAAPSQGGDHAHTTQLDNSPVDVEEEQVAVLIALIDAVEAACHYSPTCLTRLVQTGGVTAMLNLVYSPFVPESVRAAVLDTVSVLMQEVAPFRRAVSGSPSGGGDGQLQKEAGTNGEQGVEDALLAIMLEQARTGSYNYPGAQQSGDAPPFMMDRASASKFESAVRDWFSKHGLSHVVTGVVELRNLKDWRRLRGVQQQQRATVAVVAASGNTGDGSTGGTGGTTPGAMGKAGGASIETTRDSKRATQQRASTILALLQVIDGKRADLH